VANKRQAQARDACDDARAIIETVRRYKKVCHTHTVTPEHGEQARVKHALETAMQGSSGSAYRALWAQVVSSAVP
jgi:hypothetical protein